jgi:hypothetical protein
MKARFGLGGLALAIVVAAIPSDAAEAQFRQTRTETERRQCSTTAGFGRTVLPSSTSIRSYQTRTCRIELRCPGVGERRACFRVSRSCDPWPGTCSSR